MLVGQLQEYITRRFDIFDPIVVTVGQFNAGTAANVVPDEARLVVSVRTFSETVTSRAEAELPQLVRDLVAAHGLTAEVDYEQILPPTINDDAEAEFFLATFTNLFGQERTVRKANPLPGSEDFSRVLDAVPGAYGHFGAALPNLPVDEREANHSPRARHSSDGLADQALFLAHLAGRRLAQLAEDCCLGRRTDALSGGNGIRCSETSSREGAVDECVRLSERGHPPGRGAAARRRCTAH